VDDLVQFLRARLDEEEAATRAAARAERADTWTTVPDSHGGVLDGTGTRSLIVGYGDVMAPETATHIARHDPARVLAEVDAKRQIVDRMAGMLAAAEGDSEVDHYGGLDAAEGTLELLALPYADHPDYRDEWRP
jgi:hypothetical protein